MAFFRLTPKSSRQHQTRQSTSPTRRWQKGGGIYTLLLPELALLFVHRVVRHAVRSANTHSRQSCTASGTKCVWGNVCGGVWLQEEGGGGSKVSLGEMTAASEWTVSCQLTVCCQRSDAATITVSATPSSLSDQPFWSAFLPSLPYHSDLPPPLFLLPN